MLFLCFVYMSCPHLTLKTKVSMASTPSKLMARRGEGQDAGPLAQLSNPPTMEEINCACLLSCLFSWFASFLRGWARGSIQGRPGEGFARDVLP